MTDSYLQITRNGKILEIVFNKPKVNAICVASSRELGQVFSEFRDDPELRVAIFTTAGCSVFSAGWDLKAAGRGEDYLSDPGVGGWWGFTSMTDLQKPVIVAVNGHAIGAAFEMLTRADFVVAADHAEFWLPEVRRGIPPEIASYTLPRILPRQKAMELLMTGRHFSAQELSALGLINEVVTAEQVMDSARRLAAELAQGAPLALAAIKEVAQESENMSLDEYYQSMRAGNWPALEKCLNGEDFREGIEAFAQKREPEWQGR
jgi:crotonobetainyl-CoA hydratase